MNFLLHLLSSDHRRGECNLRGQFTRTFLKVFYFCQVFSKRTEALTKLLHSLTGKKLWKLLWRLFSRCSLSLSLINVLVSLDMYRLYNSIWKSSRSNSKRKLATTEQNLCNLSIRSKNFGFSYFYENTRLFCFSKLNVRAVDTTIVTVCLNPTIFLSVPSSFSFRETLSNVRDNTTSRLVGSHFS